MGNGITIVLDCGNLLQEVCGANDGNLKIIENSLGGRIAAKGNEIRLDGVDEDSIGRFKAIMDNLIAVAKDGEAPTPEYVSTLVKSLVPADKPPCEKEAAANALREAMIQIPHGFNRVYPRSKNQALYIQ